MTEFTPRKFSDGISASGRSLTLPYFWEPRAPLTQFWCMIVPARTKCPVQRHLCARDGCYHLGTLSGCWGNAPPGTLNPSPPACHNSLSLSDEVFPSFIHKQQWAAATYVAATQKRQQGEHSTHWSPAPLILKLLSSLRTPLQRREHGTDTPHHRHHTGHQHTTCFNTRVNA